MHINKGKTLSQCISDRTDYAINPEKTNNGELISSYACDHRSLDAEFALAKRQYRHFTGKDEKNDVIAYQVRQSFKPGEKDNIADEMADILWVLICLANQTGVNLTEALRANIDKKTTRDKERHLNNEKLKQD